MPPVNIWEEVDSMTTKEKPAPTPEIAAMLERFSAQLCAAGMKEPTKLRYDSARRHCFQRGQMVS